MRRTHVFGSEIPGIGAAEVAVTPKEFDLLAELMRHAGHVVTREDQIGRAHV